MDVNDADDNHGYYVEQSKMACMEGKAGEEIAGKDIAEEIAGENIHRQDTLAMQGASGAGVRGSHGEEKISEIFLCSISFEIMSDPVTTAKRMSAVPSCSGFAKGRRPARSRVWYYRFLQEMLFQP